MESNNPFDNKKSPTNTAILFFQRAFTEKKPLLTFESSTTSSCTKVAVCKSSINDAARYVESFISPHNLADKKTNIGRICLPLRFIIYCVILSSKGTELFIEDLNFNSNSNISDAIGSFIWVTVIMKPCFYSQVAHKLHQYL